MLKVLREWHVCIGSGKIISAEYDAIVDEYGWDTGLRYGEANSPSNLPEWQDAKSALQLADRFLREIVLDEDDPERAIFEKGVAKFEWSQAQVYFEALQTCQRWQADGRPNLEHFGLMVS